MNDRDGGICVFVFLHKQKGKRFADNHAASKDDDVRAADVDLAFDEQTLHAKRRARNEAGLIADCKFCNVFRMKTVHVFTRIERAHDCRFIDLLRRRRLHENAVNCRVAVQFFNTSE